MILESIVTVLHFGHGGLWYAADDFRPSHRLEQDTLRHRWMPFGAGDAS